MPVVGFPIRKRLVKQLGIEERTPDVELSLELRQIDVSIAALKRRRAAVIALYRQEVRSTVNLVAYAFAGIAGVHLCDALLFYGSLKCAHYAPNLLSLFW